MHVWPSNAVTIVDNFVQTAQIDRDAPLPEDVAFELFAASSVLRHDDVSEEEVGAGRIGGGQDGGMDAILYIP